MLTIEELKAYKAKARRQRDNWKRRAMAYRAALEEIAADPCCWCCERDDPHRDAGRAKHALHAANAGAQIPSGARWLGIPSDEVQDHSD